ncbi:MAG: hypothetical protein Q8K67_12495 [Geothrix sp.]|nr:hypothetical protein [Geothrix sp.]
MLRRFLSTILIATFTLGALPAAARPDDDRRGRREDREDRKYWKEQDKHERKFWKEREKEARKHERHRFDDDDRDHGRGRRQLAPPWMNGYWRSGEQRRYVALVPGDPSRMYVFLDGRWVLRQVRDPRARLDLEGAFRLPVAPPPIAPPRIGLDLHVVLFN